MKSLVKEFIDILINDPEVRFYNKNTTVLLYKDSEGTRRKVRAVATNEEEFDEEIGTTICLLKALRKECSRMIKQF